MWSSNEAAWPGNEATWPGNEANMGQDSVFFGNNMILLHIIRQIRSHTNGLSSMITHCCTLTCKGLCK